MALRMVKPASESVSQLVNRFVIAEATPKLSSGSLCHLAVSDVCCSVHSPSTSACPLTYGVSLLLLLPPPDQLLLLQAEQRYRELSSMGLSVNLVLVGNKGKQYFSRRPQYNIVSE
jgi:hypothetical protein